MESKTDTNRNAPAPAPPGPIPSTSSRSLFGSSRELLIEHGGEQYRLRITRLGKLILTK